MTRGEMTEYISSRLHHDAENTEYLCKIWYDLTGDEDTVKEYMEILC